MSWISYTTKYKNKYGNKITNAENKKNPDLKAISDGVITLTDPYNKNLAHIYPVSFDFFPS